MVPTMIPVASSLGVPDEAVDIANKSVWLGSHVDVFAAESLGRPFQDQDQIADANYCRRLGPETGM